MIREEEKGFGADGPSQSTSRYCKRITYNKTRLAICILTCYSYNIRCSDALWQENRRWNRRSQPAQVDARAPAPPAPGDGGRSLGY